jgi:tetratricopeptide (TPR) repeat protein
MQRKTSNQNYSVDVENLINDALSLKAKGKYSKGLKILKPLEKEFPKDSVITGIIASIFYENKDYLNSEKYFKKTILLNPNSELASLGLFHSLLFLNKVDEALYELRSFINTHQPKLYKTTIQDIKNSLCEYDENQKKIIHEILSFEK